MIKGIRFQTRARTVDHLGREQIADCPTAVSELWKNAYDAYAQNVSLHVFDAPPVEGESTAVACMCDDGHGMSYDEFVEKWLVIGTESKAGGGQTPLEDRNGLPYRRRQGKKGIGRLSVAYLANLCLLVSKRKNEDFVAALIDWRIFKNPFLNLEDIQIPSTTFKKKEELWKLLDGLFDILMNNVWGNPADPAQNERITTAWRKYDKLEEDGQKESDLFAHFATGSFVPTHVKIEKALVNASFQERHLMEWEVWNGTSEHGTAMIMADVIPEVEVLLDRGSISENDKLALKKFHDTLWCFIDPFAESSTLSSAAVVRFAPRVIGWRGDERLSIIEHGQGFKAHEIEKMEHIIDGHVDVHGVFRGRIRAFGKDREEVLVIEPDEKQPTRVDSKVGEFDVYIASIEFDRKNTSHSDAEHSRYLELLAKYSGLMVFRDGFRVMPYGRPDSDFFEIEQRRSKNAGREFWNHRQVVGRVSISERGNSNLRDKAGREGLIDNKAAKSFKQLVINILMTAARRYFGSSSPIRKEILPGLNEEFRKKQLEEAREKQAKRRLREFRTRLVAELPKIQALATEVDVLNTQVQLDEGPVAESKLEEIKEVLSDIKERRAALRLGPAPNKLADRHKKPYLEHRDAMEAVDGSIKELEDKYQKLLEDMRPEDPTAHVQRAVDQAMRRTKRRINAWEKTVGTMLADEAKRLHEHAESRIKSLSEQISELVGKVKVGELDFREALKLVDQTFESSDLENQTQFESAISILQGLSENINLGLLLTTETDEVIHLQSEVERLVSLAQLGITVEILDHELEASSSTIRYGLKNFPAEVTETRAYRQVTQGFEALDSRLRFLAPLKLSGAPDNRQIRGRDIAQHIKEFFHKDLVHGTFILEVEPAFERLCIRDQPARIYPVFINLVNNARYWVRESESDSRKVILAVRDEKVVVADSGPGVPREDLPDLFKLFFTRRHGGRGVGLYLCRANLIAGGHKISYATDGAFKVLPGANFVIEFQGASFSD